MYNYFLYNAESKDRWLGLGSRTATGFCGHDGCALEVRGWEKRNKRTLPIFFYGYDPLVRMLAIVYLG